MKCIVTAGPTYEQLDEVRRMTNFSTGALGTELANFLAAHGCEVELLRGHYATSSIEPAAQRVQVFTTTKDLARRLKELSASGAGAVFHAAAVSDFAFGQIWQRAENGDMTEIKGSKISTRRGTLLAELVPTPKIIARLREWFPHAYLTGWKYEVDGGHPHIFELAKNQIDENKTDACVVNGTAYGPGFGLLNRAGAREHLADKAALFNALLAIIQTS